MFNIQQTVGMFFENLVAELLGLEILDNNMSEKLPDLKDKKERFFMEVKASRFDNGGVVKGWQLEEHKNFMPCFYAFAFHEAEKPMNQYYPTKKSLENDLYLRSLYIFSFDIVEAQYTRFNKRPYKTGDDFSQIKESLASNIFQGKKRVWNKLKLTFEDYCEVQQGGNVFVMAKDKSQIEMILENYHPEVLGKYPLNNIAKAVV